MRINYVIELVLVKFVWTYSFVCTLVSCLIKKLSSLKIEKIWKYNNLTNQTEFQNISLMNLCNQVFKLCITISNNIEYRIKM